MQNSNLPNSNMQNPNVQNSNMLNQNIHNPNICGQVQPSAIVVPTQMANNNPDIVDRYPSNTVKILSITGIIIGSLMIIFNIIGLVICTLGHWMIGHGFWVGIMVIVTSSIGLHSAASKGKCAIIAFLVLSCITTVVCIILFAWIVTGITIDQIVRGDRYHSYGGNYCGDGVLAIDIIAALIWLAQFGFGIWQSVIGCRYTCCYSNPNQAPYVGYYPDPLTGQMTTNAVILQYTSQQVPVIAPLLSPAPVLPANEQAEQPTLQSAAPSQVRPSQQPSSATKTAQGFDYIKL